MRVLGSRGLQGLGVCGVQTRTQHLFKLCDLFDPRPDHGAGIMGRTLGQPHGLGPGIKHMYKSHKVPGGPGRSVNACGAL